MGASDSKIKKDSKDNASSKKRQPNQSRSTIQNPNNTIPENIIPLDQIRSTNVIDTSSRNQNPQNKPIQDKPSQDKQLQNKGQSSILVDQSKKKSLDESSQKKARDNNNIGQINSQSNRQLNSQASNSIVNQSRQKSINESNNRLRTLDDKEVIQPEILLSNVEIPNALSVHTNVNDHLEKSLGTNKKSQDEMVNEQRNISSIESGNKSKVLKSVVIPSKEALKSLNEGNKPNPEEVQQKILPKKLSKEFTSNTNKDQGRKQPIDQQEIASKQNLKSNSQAEPIEKPNQLNTKGLSKEPKEIEDDQEGIPNYNDHKKKCKEFIDKAEKELEKVLEISSHVVNYLVQNEKVTKKLASNLGEFFSMTKNLNNLLNEVNIELFDDNNERQLYETVKKFTVQISRIDKYYQNYQNNRKTYQDFRVFACNVLEKCGISIPENEVKEEEILNLQKDKIIDDKAEQKLFDPGQIDKHYEKDRDLKNEPNDKLEIKVNPKDSNSTYMFNINKPDKKTKNAEIDYSSKPKDIISDLESKVMNNLEKTKNDEPIRDNDRFFMNSQAIDPNLENKSKIRSRKSQVFKEDDQIKKDNHNVWFIEHDKADQFGKVNQPKKVNPKGMLSQPNAKNEVEIESLKERKYHKLEKDMLLNERNEAIIQLQQINKSYRDSASKYEILKDKHEYISKEYESLKKEVNRLKHEMNELEYENNVLDVENNTLLKFIENISQNEQLIIQKNNQSKFELAQALQKNTIIDEEIKRIDKDHAIENMEKRIAQGNDELENMKELYRKYTEKYRETINSDMNQKLKDLANHTNQAIEAVKRENKSLLTERKSLLSEQRNLSNERNSLLSEKRYSSNKKMIIMEEEKKNVVHEKWNFINEKRNAATDEKWNVLNEKSNMTNERWTPSTKRLNILNEIKSAPNERWNSSNEKKNIPKETFLDNFLVKEDEIKANASAHKAQLATIGLENHLPDLDPYIIKTPERLNQYTNDNNSNNTLLLPDQLSDQRMILKPFELNTSSLQSPSYSDILKYDNPFKSNYSILQLNLIKIDPEEVINRPNPSKNNVIERAKMVRETAKLDQINLGEFSLDNMLLNRETIK